MRETDPRHMPPDYYFDQIDWLTAYQKGKAWDWVELRPQTLCGYAPGTAMSILPAIAVYASIAKELGLPLRFPGHCTVGRMKKCFACWRRSDPRTMSPPTSRKSRKAKAS